jgi:hypothetical protein
MLLVALVVAMAALPSRPPLRPHRIGRRTASHRIDRRTALQTAAAATAAAVALPARAEDGMVWIPKEQAPVKSVITSYQPTFITYLSRFLLNYDRSSANWWRDQLRNLPLSLDRRQLVMFRERQFGQFSESVEVGLQRYQGRDGVRALFSFLKSRYGTSPQAKLQLALLFSIISPRNQPSALIRRALGQADDGVVTEACVLDGGRGYSSAERPAVVASAPEGGGPSAVVRAELAPTGQLLSIEVRKGGSGYLAGEAPVVRISPPSRVGTRPAQAVARVENGRVVALELTDRGRGYRTRDVVTVTIDPPRTDLGMSVTLGETAEASAVLESGVVRLVLEDGGKGYARDQVRYRRSNSVARAAAAAAAHVPSLTFRSSRRSASTSRRRCSRAGAAPLGSSSRSSCPSNSRRCPRTGRTPSTKPRVELLG